MFKLTKQGNDVQIWFGDWKMFDGLSIQATLDTADRRILELNAITKRTEQGPESVVEHTLRFEDGKGEVAFDLIFCSRGSFMAIRVDVEIQNDERFKKQRYFAPRDGVRIKFRDGMENYRFMANYQHKDWWTRPHFGCNVTDVPAHTLSLLMEGGFGYFHLLPVSDTITKTELKGVEGGLELSVSDCHGAYDRFSQWVLVTGVGKDPYGLVKENAKAAFTILENGKTIREEKRYPEILDYLGWCTWDAFYQDVDEIGILKKAEEFRKKDIPVKWVMIDDGWLDVKGKKLKSLRPDPEKFPRGLAATVSDLKDRFGIRWVGVWHTIVGYWEGIDPESPLAERMKSYLFRTKNGSLVPYPDAVKGFGFWHNWHSYLRAEGIDFLKVDSQSAVNNFLTGHMSAGEAAEGAHTALEASVSLHFQNAVINCMGMAQDNIWHRPYSSVSRNSDDFVPQAEDGFREHALQNVYNSFFHGAFYWGDWDMFWTKNHDSLQNMVLRAVSGGPVYISDPVGETDPASILPLVYRDGKIIRCGQPGLPTIDCLFTDPIQEAKPLKVWNVCKGAGVVAAFNIHGLKMAVRGTVGPSDIPGMEEERFLAIDVLKKQFMIFRKDQSVPIELSENGVSLFLFLPIKDDFTPVGLIDKLVPNDSVLGVWRGENGVKVFLKEGGRFVFRSESEPVDASVNGKKLKVWETGTPGLYWIDCRVVPGEALVEIETK
jgi:raffinose synthase